MLHYTMPSLSKKCKTYNVGVQSISTGKVGWLDVSVDESNFMEILKGFQTLNANAKSSTKRESTSLPRLFQISQTLSNQINDHVVVVRFFTFINNVCEVVATFFLKMWQNISFYYLLLTL